MQVMDIAICGQGVTHQKGVHVFKGGFEMNKEKWIEVQFNSDYPYRWFMLLSHNIVAKVYKLVETYHHFYEPKPNFLIRLKPKNQNDVSLIKKLVNEEIAKFKNTPQPYIKPKDKVFTHKFAIYKGEQDSFGMGWPVVKKLFQAFTDYSHVKAVAYYFDMEKTCGKWFVDSKIVHCLLNHIGYKTREELLFYADMQAITSCWLAETNVEARLKKTLGVKNVRQKGERNRSIKS